MARSLHPGTSSSCAARRSSEARVGRPKLMMCATSIALALGFNLQESRATASVFPAAKCCGVGFASSTARYGTSRASAFVEVGADRLLVRRLKRHHRGGCRLSVQTQEPV